MAIDNPPPESADEQAEAPGSLPSPPPPNKPPALPNKTIFVTGLSGAFLGAVAGFGACAGVVAVSPQPGGYPNSILLLLVLPLPLIGAILGASGFIHLIKREARAAHRRAIARKEPAQEASGPNAPVSHHESSGYSAMGGVLGFFLFLALLFLPVLLYELSVPIVLKDYFFWISIVAIVIVILFIASKAGSTWRNARAGRFHAKGLNGDSEEMRSPRKTTTASSTGPAGCDSETRSAASDSPIG